MTQTIKHSGNYSAKLQSQYVALLELVLLLPEMYLLGSSRK